MTIWELDFYSRPMFDEKKKKVWEVLICQSATDSEYQFDSAFKYAEFCSNKTVNSIWLAEAITKAIEEAGETPQKIRFFRRPMKNMITKACEDKGITPVPSRRTYALNRWFNQRLTDFYPHQPGYDASAVQSPSVQYPAINAIVLPDAIKGDRGDKWAFVSLEVSAFEEMNEWEIAFGEAFPLSLLELASETKIPGLIMFSPRATPLAAWMSGLELAFLKFENTAFPRVIMETSLSDSWILANVTDGQTLAEAKGFSSAKEKSQGVHFLAVQSNPESESFEGFWLLKG